MDERRNRLLSFASDLMEAAGPPPTSLAAPRPQAAAPEPTQAQVASSVADGELAALAARLEATPSEDTASLVEVLEELGRQHVTTDLLRELRLGLLTRGLIEHPDRAVRTSVRRLRTSWKKLVLECRNSGADGAESGVA